MKIKLATLSRTERFSAAHHLTRQNLLTGESGEDFGPCSGVHGHDYVLTVTVSAPFDEEKGVLVNAVRLGEIMRERVVSKVDHCDLNSDVPFLKGLMPSMENLAYAFAKELEEALGFEGLTLHSITVSETAKNSATLFFE